MKRNLFLFLLFLCPIVVFSQNFEVAGKAKVKIMDTDNTAEYIVVKQADGTLAVRNLSTIATDGSNPANEIQDLTLVGNILQITKNGTATSIDLSQYLDDTKLSENEVDGFVANNGYLTVHIDSLGVAALGYVAGSHSVDTKLDSAGVAALGYVAGSHSVDTKLDSMGVAALGYVAGTKTLTEILTESTDAGKRKITNLASPTDSLDAATKAYVDLLEAKIAALEGVKDIDKNRYEIVTIGTQTWMSENLKTTRYNDGSAIPLIADDDTAWETASTNGAPAYTWNGNVASNLITYGGLYNWYAIDTLSNEGKNVCPTGWHVPTDAEWTTLTTYLGGESVAGGKMKEAGLARWTSPNEEATNESGFAGLPSGYRGPSGIFSNVGNNGSWWSSTEDTFAWNRLLNYYDGNVNRFSFNKGFGFSVRCLRD
jgi:uncharacterized protein (TIGR02145 family)